MISSELFKYVEKLFERKRTRITEKELRGIVPFDDYDIYHGIIKKLVEDNILSPVISSGPNGMNPPLYKRYGINKPKVDYTGILPQIRLLHGRLNIDGYLADPEKYMGHKPWLSPIDGFLKNRERELEVSMSINERSFQIFGKEKALKEDRELEGVLVFNPGLREGLNFYETPEPFFIFDIKSGNENSGNENSRNEYGPISSNEKGIIKNVLILENKDTWYTLKSIMTPEHCGIAGVCFDSLIYGEGRKIARRKDSLTDFSGSYYRADSYRQNTDEVDPGLTQTGRYGRADEDSSRLTQAGHPGEIDEEDPILTQASCLGGTDEGRPNKPGGYQAQESADISNCKADVRYYYFGDLDYEGICIVHDLIKINPALTVEVFKPLYIAMLNEAEKSSIPLPISSEKQDKRAADWFLSLFDGEYRGKIVAILGRGQYIPQEILNRSILADMLE